MFFANRLRRSTRPIRNRNTKEFAPRSFRPLLEQLETRVVPSIIDHSGGFASHGDLTANGSASFTGTVARLTNGGFYEAGSFFTNGKVTITNFTTQFTLVLAAGTNPTADGITFTIQNDPAGASALGFTGGGLGYGWDQPGGPIGITHSVAIKLDLFSNAGEGIDSTGIFTEGRSPTVRQTGLASTFPDASVTLAGSGIDLHSQHQFLVTLTYDGTTLNETIHDNTTAASFTTSYTVDIASIVGGSTAFVGFTGGTGALTAVQDIDSWQGSFGLTLTPPGNQSATEGAAHTFNLGSFSDPGANSWTVDVKWGDSTPDTMFTTTTQGSLGTQPHTYGEEGNYTVTITVTDNLTNTGSTAFQVAVSDPAVLATCLNVHATAGAPFVGPVATFTDPGAAEPNTSSHYTASINWGDSTPAATGTITLSAGVFTVSSNHTYAAAGPYTITISINHEGVITTAPCPTTVVNLGITVQPGLTATIGFWQGPQGQKLINSFGITSTGLTLGQWLATTFPKLYGGVGGAPNLSSDTDDQVAAFYVTVHDTQGQKLNAQVLDTALDVFATTSSLGGTTATAYGFTVNAFGLGAYSWNIGSSGAAFGVPNNTTLNVYQILLAANNSAVAGSPWDTNASLRDLANTVFDGLNQAGDIP